MKLVLLNNAVLLACCTMQVACLSTKTNDQEIIMGSLYGPPLEIVIRQGIYNEFSNDLLKAHTIQYEKLSELSSKTVQENPGILINPYMGAYWIMLPGKNKIPFMVDFDGKPLYIDEDSPLFSRLYNVFKSNIEAVAETSE